MWLRTAHLTSKYLALPFKRCINSVQRFPAEQATLSIRFPYLSIDGRLYLESSTLYATSRFPGSQIVTQRSFSYDFHTMDSYALLPDYSDRLAWDLHPIPFSPARFSRADALVTPIWNLYTSSSYSQQIELSIKNYFRHNPKKIPLLYSFCRASLIAVIQKCATIRKQTKLGKSHKNLTHLFWHFINENAKRFAITSGKSPSVKTKPDASYSRMGSIASELPIVVSCIRYGRA